MKFEVSVAHFNRIRSLWIFDEELADMSSQQIIFLPLTNCISLPLGSNEDKMTIGDQVTTQPTSPPKLVHFIYLIT